MLSRRDFLKAAAIGTALPLPAASSLRPDPWVQNLCRGRASICWRSSDRGLGRVEFAPVSGPVSQVVPQVSEFLPSKTRLSYPFYLYRADLTNLRPATDYYYRVFMDGSPVTAAEGVRIRTGGGTAFDFHAFGDCGLGTPEQRDLAQRMVAENAALAVITGDVVYMNGSYEEYEQNFFPYYSEMMRRVPIFPSPGNHDYGTDNLGPYLALHALPTDNVPTQDQGRYYSFDWGNVHFVSIDTNASLVDAVTTNRGRMLDWLAQDLEQASSFWKIVYAHHPPITWGIHFGDRTLPMVQNYVVPILERYKADLYLAGHDHSYMRSKPMKGGKVVNSPDAITYVITGGGGANLYPVFGGEEMAAGESAYHYVRAEVRGARMTVRAIRIDGRQIDAFTLAPPPFICSAYLNPAPAVGFREFYTPVATIYGRHLAIDTVQATELPLPRSMAGTRVTFHGRALPLLSVSDTRIEVQLPHMRSWANLRVETANGSADTDVVFSERPAGPLCNWNYPLGAP